MATTTVQYFTVGVVDQTSFVWYPITGNPSTLGQTLYTSNDANQYLPATIARATSESSISATSTSITTGLSSTASEASISATSISTSIVAGLSSTTSKTSLSTSVRGGPRVSSSTTSLVSSTTNTTAPGNSSGPHASGSSTNAGAIAGAAVGSFVGGLLVGALIAWLLFRRRKQSKPPIYSDTDAGEKNGLASSSNSKGVNLVRFGSVGGVQLDHYLLDGAPDEEIGMEVRALGDLICQHVEGHYHIQAVHDQEAALSRTLARLRGGQEWEISSKTVAALCVDPRTRSAGLRYVISSILFRTIDLDARYPLSMLPPPVASFSQAMPPIPKSGAMSMAASQWRRLSALLLHPNRNDRTSLPVSEASVASNAAQVVSALNEFLQPFSTSPKEQAGHLQDVVIEVTKLGYQLFSHPCDWAFEYAATNAEKRVMVVCPGLSKLSQRDGKRLGAPQILVQPSGIAI